MAKDLADRGCLQEWDGIGFKSHVDLTYASENYDSILTNFKRYEAIKLYSYYSEVDVKCSTNSEVTCASPWTAANLTQQANIYGGLFKSCLCFEHCFDFTTFGYTDWASPYKSPQNAFMLDAEF